MRRHEEHGAPEFELTFDDIRSTGLLWKINHDLLHPLGLALAVAPANVVPDDVGAVQVSVMVARDGVWHFAPGMDDAGAEAWARWLESTAGPEMDQVQP